jgi:hypothetical protein
MNNRQPGEAVLRGDWQPRKPQHGRSLLRRGSRCPARRRGGHTTLADVQPDAWEDADAAAEAEGHWSALPVVPGLLITRDISLEFGTGLLPVFL